MSPLSRTREARGRVLSRTTPGSHERWTPTGWRLQPAFFAYFLCGGKESKWGVSDFLCARQIKACRATGRSDHILQVASGEAILVEDRKLVHGRFPVVGLAWLHPAVTLRSASHSSLVAASSFGKWPRVLTVLRSCVQTLDGVGRVDDPAYLRWKHEERDDVFPGPAPGCHDGLGNFCPHSPCSNASSASAAWSLTAA